MKKQLTHGSAHTYIKYKCRCAPCTAAVQLRYAKKNENRNKKRRAVKPIKKINASPLIEQVQLISEVRPDIYSKYARQISGWTKYGVDVWTADRICIELSMHPIQVFGQAWIDEALEEDDLVLV
jgi:hypothetical protein